MHFSVINVGKTAFLQGVLARLHDLFVHSQQVGAP